MSSETMKNTRPPKGGLGMGGGPRGGMGLAEKPKNFKGSIKKLFSFSEKYRIFFVIAIILAVVSATFTLIGPGYLSEIVDLITVGLTGSIDMVAVLDIALFLVIIYILSLILGYTQSTIMAITTQRITKRMRSKVIAKLNKMPLSYFDTKPYGETLSIVTNDIDTIGTSLNQSLSSLISGVFTFVGAFILMLSTNWIMAIAGFLATIVGFSLMIVIITNSQKFFRANQNELSSLNGHIEEAYTGHTVIKAYNAEGMLQDKFNKNNKRLFEAGWKSQYISGLMMPIMSFVGNLSYVVVSIVGAVLAIEGYITFGVIVSFMIYIRMFTQPLSQLAQISTSMQSAAAASERVFDLLEREELADETGKTELSDDVRGDVSFKNVSFGYNPEKIIIKNFSAEITAGQKVAIVGPTGAGKTTLVNLLMRFYELNSGEISLDGVNIHEVTRESLRDRFSMVLQDSWIFEGTIFDNIVFNREDITLEQVKVACRAVGIHHTIKTMPSGYDTVMSDAALSAGEKQLLAIARAMVKDSDLLILDEATSSVDTRTEMLITAAMDKLAAKKTSFIIAHRLSTIKNADVIIVMKDGNVIESGNHETLLAKNGFYAELYNSQFEED